jgi:uncharacterized cofD-like protein
VVSDQTGPRVVALGGGHGLAASLRALREVTDNLTAVVTVADDGGSSGRLRRDLGVLPPGDLRMALAALCEDSEWGRTWSQVVQHRFRGEGELHGHAVGNLLIVALWEIVDDDPVAGLAWMGRLLNCHGTVLPMSTVPLEISATVVDDDAEPPSARVVRGQVAVATSTGRILDVTLSPDAPPACPQAVTAINEADWLVLGPGSWYTSVLPHLLVPDLGSAICQSPARRCVVLNLDPQVGETTGFAPESYLQTLADHAPDLRLDLVIADEDSVADPSALTEAVDWFGASLLVVPVRETPGMPYHSHVALAKAFETAFSPRGPR